MRLSVADLGVGLGLLLAGCAAGDMPSIDLGAGSGTLAGRQGNWTAGALRQAPDVPEEACEGPAAAQCKFINSPVKLSRKSIRLPGEPYPFFHTRNTLKFVDARGQTWVAPAGILTDGASIPPLFVPLIGDPRSPEFLNAAVVHDSYSAESNRDTPYYHAAPWQDVHRMFYDALRVSGTPPVKAKIMYAAVYLGGPRWKEVRTPPPARRAALPHGAPASNGTASLQTRLPDGTAITAAAAKGLRALQSDTPLPALYDRQRLIAAFRQAKTFIERRNPPIHQVEIYLTQLEQELAGARPPRPQKKTNFGARPIDRNADPLEGGGDGGSGNDAGAGEGGGLR